MEHRDNESDRKIGLKEILKGGLGKTLFLCFLLFAFVPLTVVSVTSYQQARESLVESTIKSLKAVMRVKLDFLRSHFKGIEQEITNETLTDHNIGMLQEMDRAYKSSGQSFNEFSRSVEAKNLYNELSNDISIFASTHAFDNVYLIKTDGTVIFSAPAEEAIGENVFSGVYAGTLFSLAMKKAVKTGEIVFSDYEKFAPADYRVESFIVKSILNDQGKTIGAIAIQLSIEEIDRIIQENSGLWETEDIYLIGKDLKMRSDSVLSEKSTALEVTVDTEQSRLWLEHVKNPVPFEEHTAMTYKDYRDTTVIGIHDTVEIGGIRLGLIGEINEDEAVKPATRLKYIMFALLAVTALMVFVITPAITRRLVLPVLKLSEGTRLVTKGDLNRTIAVATRNELGSLARNFNEMINELRNSRDEREEQNWLRNGRFEIDNRMRGDKNIEDLCDSILSFLVPYLDAQVGALYVNENNILRLQASYAYSTRKNISSEFKFGEGLVGQAAHEKKSIRITHVPEDYMSITSGLGETHPEHILITPLIYNKIVVGVIEIGSLREMADLKMTFLEQVAGAIAIALNSSNTRMEIKRMLNLTMKQSSDLQEQQEKLKATNTELEDKTRRLMASEEELRTQQEELQVTNEELTEKTKKLQASEEELKAQQEELQVSNEELEEKTTALEEQKMALETKNSMMEKIQLDLERKAKELSVASRYKSEFLANMSHELRTPLNSLLILAQDLLENRHNNLDTEQVESARIIYSSGHDLLKLINEILDLSKIEAGKMTLTLEEIDLSEISDGIESGFRHLAEEKGLNLNVMRDENLPRVVTDRQRLGQIIKNLISNAIKFTEEGDITVHFMKPSEGVDLTRSGLQRESAVAVSVSDTGIGIAESKQLDIFEAFQQVEGGTARRYGGTGLGLSIARELAKLLKGEIQLESQEGEGSTFTLLIPHDSSVAPAPVHQVKPAVSSELPPERRKPLASTGVTAPSIDDDRDTLTEDDRIILIIEDDLNFAKTLYRISRERGFKCIHAGDGESGIRLLYEFTPDAIILDLKLPGIQGWEVLDVVKNNSDTRHIPVHIISVEDVSAEAGKKGAIGFLTKPVNKEQLQGVFEKIEDLIDRAIKALLIVEDDDIQREYLNKLIGNGDIRTVTVKTGTEAIDEIRAHKYDCIILDLKLPDISGFQVLDTLALEGTGIPPVIVYTSKELTHEEEYKLQEYTSSVIVKGERSDERLLDETSLFLHRIVGNLPQQKKMMIASLYDEDPHLRGKKILLADDDMRNVFAISKVLEDKGITVLKAADGKEALHILENNSDIDLVLMDIMMPVMDGYEAMKRIRSRDSLKDLPVIAITAKAMKEDRDKCIAAGANDYIFKPVEINRLLSLMRIWMHKE